MDLVGAIAGELEVADMGIVGCFGVVSFELDGAALLELQNTEVFWLHRQRLRLELWGRATRVTTQTRAMGNFKNLVCKRATMTTSDNTKSHSNGNALSCVEMAMERQIWGP